jgi:hypothetical protein
MRSGRTRTTVPRLVVVLTPTPHDAVRPLFPGEIEVDELVRFIEGDEAAAAWLQKTSTKART